MFSNENEGDYMGDKPDLGSSESPASGGDGGTGGEGSGVDAATQKATDRKAKLKSAVSGRYANSLKRGRGK